MSKTCGVIKRRDGYEAWMLFHGKKETVGVYQSKELADAVSHLCRVTVADTPLGPTREEDLDPNHISLLDTLGVLRVLQDLTGWKMCVNLAYQNEEKRIKEYIHFRIDQEIAVRRQKAISKKEFQKARAFLFLHVQSDGFPPIPTASILATEDAREVPAASGIYFVWDRNDCLQYVGQSINLQSRARLQHERICRGDRVSWLLFPIMELYFAEAYYIGIGRPPLNFGNFQEHHRIRAIEAGETTCGIVQ